MNASMYNVQKNSVSSPAVMCHNEDDLQNLDALKIKMKPKMKMTQKDNPKNVDDPKSEDNPKNGDFDLKAEILSAA